MYCSHCGHKLLEGTRICGTCGMPFDPNDVLLFDEEVPDRAQEAADSEQEDTVPAAGLTFVGGNEYNGDISEERGPQKRSCRKPILILGIGGVLAAVAVILLVVLTITHGSRAAKKANSVLYLKDNEIIYNDFSLDGEFEITSRLTNGENVDKGTLAWAAASYGNTVTISDKGNRIFFPDRINVDDFGMKGRFTLYCRDLDHRDEDAAKIDSDIILYAINQDGTTVVYLKGDDGDLYTHDLSEKEKIDGGVNYFYCTEDLMKICYLSDNNRLYLWSADGGSTKLASDISDVAYVSDDLSTIYYIKNDALYKQGTDGGYREKIASNVDNIITFDSGKLYFAEVVASELKIWDYVDDDLAASDALITEPRTPDYPDKPVRPSSWDYPTTEKYNEAKVRYDNDYELYKETCDRLKNEYSDACDAYQGKCAREVLREDLHSATLDYSEYIWYYYDGYRAELLPGNIADLKARHESAAVMVVSVYNTPEIPRIKLSEISSVDEANELIDDYLFGTTEYRLVVGAETFALQETGLHSAWISSDGSLVAFLADPSGSVDGFAGYDLYTVSIKDGRANTPERFDYEVDYIAALDFDADHIIYYKDGKDSAGDLYMNGNVIDYDVYMWHTLLADDIIVYYVDWDSEQRQGTLRLYENGKKTTIADDVHDFVVTDCGDILYLCDYSTKYYTGVLYRYRNGNSEEVADDVIGLIELDNVQ